jgi:thiosulfate reductase cytochrome b subunit
MILIKSWEERRMTQKVLIKRHGIVVRLTHWTNALAMLVLLLSGLQIFNAHPALYWGEDSRFDRPWVAMVAQERGGELKGVTSLGGRTFDTTGVLGVSYDQGVAQVRGFPSWLTLPTNRSLADGRRWHFFFAWVFAITGAIYLATAILSGRLWRELLPKRDELRPRHFLKEVWGHLRFRFAKGEEARHYNLLQKLAYLSVILVLGPLMLASGLTMSPGMDAAAPWLLDLFGGRQSARTIHFIVAGLIVLFAAVHLFMVLVSGPLNNLRSMITGRYAIDVEGDAP